MIRRLPTGANRRTVLHAACLVIAALVLLAAWNPEPRPALGMEQSNRAKVAAASTPVANADEVAETSSDPLDGDRGDGERRQADPLDGDPLDGDPGSISGAKDEVVRLEITRSGRPEGTPQSVVAYDDDPETVWEPEEVSRDSWLWLDLGEVHELRQVRWLASGTGTIDISISTDRKAWEEVDSLEVRDLWQETSLRNDARYVRLELRPGDEGALPAVSEVKVYGKEESDDASLEQKAKSERKGNKNRNKNKNKNGKKERQQSGKSSDEDASSEADTNNGNKNKDNKSKDSGNGDSDGNSGGSTQEGISVEAGETRCSGDRDRCRARAGEVDVEDDCGDGSTCTIDIRADGGSATCDATGGNENKAGNGEGRRSGDGGRCEAVANGGSVAIGDINP